MAWGLFSSFFLEGVVMAEVYLWCCFAAVTYGAMVTLNNSKPY